MSVMIVIVFILGYILIAFEHSLKIDKASTALLTGVICWLMLLYGIAHMPVNTGITGTETSSFNYVHQSLFHHLGEIAEILFFLLGAMTIVELIDVHHGFRVITDRISTTNRIKLVWMISWITFFLSAGLDNLTTAIVMCALLRKILKKQEDLWFFGGFVIIAANAGGAWSPIGDVTTIMLWIGGQVTTFNIITATFLASAACLVVPLLFGTYFLRNENNVLETLSHKEIRSSVETTSFERNLLFFMGIGSLLAVPIFKSITHLPPYMGILFVLGLLWFVTDVMHKHKQPEIRREFSVAYILHKIDTPTILFFLGILLAVSSLEVSGHLRGLADVLDDRLGNIYLINGAIGLLSAIVDNVPLVAACMGMYDLSQFPQDHDFWELLAYCAGTGGSILIIGSAAGVAAMGILKMNFMWFLKKISVYSLIGYFAGILVYYLQHK
ncbi:MAG TPA: sodium:proton antiporter NhaD [Saprospiraceae bacterium]|nr:sodium:proton antiporter NhaD [Saprospiraceae bacterium]